MRASLRDDLRVFKKEFRNNFNYIPVDQVHVNVKYIGDRIKESSRDILIDTLKDNQTKMRRISFEISKISFGFKSQSDPIVLKYDLLLTDDLDDLIDQTNDICKKTMLSDIVKFKAKPDYHMTLARRRPNAPRKIKNEVNAFLNQYNKSKNNVVFEAETIELVQSIQTKTEVVHRIIQSFKLS